MARSRIVVNLATGEQNGVLYSTKAEAEADAAHEAEKISLEAAPAPLTATEKLATFLKMNRDVLAPLD